MKLDLWAQAGAMRLCHWLLQQSFMAQTEPLSQLPWHDPFDHAVSSTKAIAVACTACDITCSQF
jgi:hypothetical protein